MEAKNSSRLLLLTAIAALLLSQNLALSSPNFQDQKTYYPPDPNAHPPPTVSYSPPGHSPGGGGGHATPTPSHGTPPSHGGGGSYGGTPPSHGGGGSYGGTPPVNCGTPPRRGGGTHDPPSGGGGTHDPPTGGGGGHHTTPAPPTGGGGGGYYHSPPTTPTIPTTPTTPTTPIVNPPTTPIVNPPTTPIITPPTTPIVIPGTPGITIPSPAFPFDPNSPPFSCNYWRNHPTLVWGLIGWWGTVGNAFGVPTSSPGLGSNMNLIQALSNTRSDGFGELYRQGTAALLNSMAHSTSFPYTTTQVRDSFIAALVSNRAASSQARLFKLANEGRN